MTSGAQLKNVSSEDFFWYNKIAKKRPEKALGERDGYSAKVTRHARLFVGISSDSNLGTSTRVVMHPRVRVTARGLCAKPLISRTDAATFAQSHFLAQPAPSAAGIASRNYRIG